MDTRGHPCFQSLLISSYNGCVHLHPGGGGIMARQLGCPLSVSSARRGAAVLLFSLGSSIYVLGFHIKKRSVRVPCCFPLISSAAIFLSFLVSSVWIGKLPGRVPVGMAAVFLLLDSFFLHLFH